MEKITWADRTNQRTPTGETYEAAAELYNETKTVVNNNSDDSVSKTETPDQSIASNLQVKKQLTVEGGIIPFAAAATFDMDNGNEQEMVVTSNMTSLKITNKKAPASYGIYLVQDADGGNTIPDPDSTFGTKTTNSADFTTAPNGRSIIDIRVFPSGLTQYSIETVEP